MDTFFLSRGHEDFCRTKNPMTASFFRYWSERIIFGSGMNTQFYTNLKEPPYYKLLNIDYQKIEELRDELLGDQIEWIDLDSIYITGKKCGDGGDEFGSYTIGHTGKYMQAFTASVHKYGVISPVLVVQRTGNEKWYNLIEGKHRTVGATFAKIKGLKIPALVLVKAQNAHREE